MFNADQQIARLCLGGGHPNLLRINVAIDALVPVVDEQGLRRDSSRLNLKTQQSIAILIMTIFNEKPAVLITVNFANFMTTRSGSLLPKRMKSEIGGVDEPARRSEGR